MASKLSQDEVDALVSASRPRRSRWAHGPDDSDEDKVFRQVALCLDNLVGGSGHLGSYALARDSFAITDRRAVDGYTRFEFRVTGALVTEFEGDDRPPDKLVGFIELDAAFVVGFDSAGRTRIGPWRCLDTAVRRRIEDLRGT